MKFDDGVHEISNSEYHGSDGISRSMLMELKKTPYHYWFKYLSGMVQPEQESKALVEGELIHTVVLEPHELNERFFVLPDMDRRTKAGKELYASIMLEHGHKTLIKEDQLIWAKVIAEMVARDDLASSLIDGARIEQSIFFTHEKTGIQCKVRPDIWLPGVVADLKTTQDASYRGMQLSAVKYGYFIQAGMISMALRSIGQTLEKFVIIAVEKKAPFAVCCYPMDEAAIEYGENLADELLCNLLECTAKGKWPSYPMKSLSVPLWAHSEQLDVIDYEDDEDE